MPPTPKQTKYFCYTYNNPTETPAQWKEKWASTASYHIFQKEEGDEGATPHFQGYLEFNSKMRITALVAHAKGPHYEGRLGTQAQAIEYCKKRDSTYREGPWDSGIPFKSNQGARKDVDEAARLVKPGSVDKLVQEDPGAYMQFHAGADKLAMRLLETHPNRTGQREVILHYGPSDLGKTYTFFEEHPDGFKCDGYKYGFLTGYKGEDAVLFDELNTWDDAKAFAPFWESIMDPYKCQVRVHYGYCPWVTTKIYISTNKHPVHWNMPDDRWNPIKRRIKKVRIYYAKGEFSEITPEHEDWNKFWNGPAIPFTKGRETEYYSFMSI